MEAAILMPLLLFAIMKGLLLGVELYHEVQVSAAGEEQLSEINPVSDIWKRELIRKGVEQIHEYTVSEKSEE